MRYVIALLAAGLSALAASPPRAAGDAPAAPLADYLTAVKPVLAERCYACHGVLKQKAGLRLDAAPLIRKGSDNGPIVVPGKPDESRLIDAVTGAHDAKRMPKEGAPLSAEQVAALRSWVEHGAVAPDEPAPPDPREHWAFRPPVRSAVPLPRDADLRRWVRDPIDAFVAAEYERHGLKPRPEADRATLLRRAYLDLTGLPPTRNQLRSFLNDDSPDAYEKVVDELLASPRYGERWGRHWLDVWRYSDWAGFGMEVRESQPFLWRWRDWVIESLNADAPYDRMVTDMLAADEAEPLDASALRATGYLARDYYKFNRNVWMDAAVEHTSKAFLGLTLNCAKCHDHKFDPLAQKEYYQFRAVFEPYDVRTDRVPGEPDVKKDGLARVFDKDASRPTYLFVRGNDKTPATDAPLAPAVPAVLGVPLDVKPVALPPAAYYPGLAPFVRDEALAAARAEAEKARVALARAESALIDARRAGQAIRAAEDAAALADARRASAEAAAAAVEARLAADRARYADPPTADRDDLALAAGRAQRRAAVCAAEEAALRAEQNAAAARAALVLKKQGQDEAPLRKSADAAEKPLAESRTALEGARAALPQPSAAYPPLGEVYPAASTGRRLALARWVTDRRNPLAARVAVNHVWMRHFGEPLVPTVFDFGLNGKPPTHPALLDWLAVEFMEPSAASGSRAKPWGMKSLHRLIVTSAAYRMDSSAPPDDPDLGTDPDNRYLWHMNPRRMEAEVVRDSVLSAAGKLDPTAGGPDLDPALGLTNYRRSVYFRTANEKQMVFLQVFDAPSPTECYRRSQSVVPQQALALANSPLALSMARSLARDLSKEAGATDAAFIAAAFEQVLGRGPTNAEREACEQFLREQAERLKEGAKLTAFAGAEVGGDKPAADPRQRAREDLVHVLLNHNDFVTVR